MMDSFRGAASALCRRAAYLCAADFGFELALHPKLSIQRPSQWLGVEEPAQEPGELFFGYYDKTPWSSDMSRMLLHQRLGDGTMTIVVLDRGMRKQSVVAKSSAWNWQQGSMAQWLEGPSDSAVIFNDIEDRRLVSRIVSVSDGLSRVIPWPIQTVHPDGSEALTLNYRRLDILQPEYGYGIDVANFRADKVLADDGIWRVDLTTGEADLSVSLLELVESSSPCTSMRGAKHTVNHICYSPSGDNFVFLHRWFGRAGKFSRLYIADQDLNETRLLLDDGMVSHYSWRDARWIVAWARTVEHGDSYYLIDTISGSRDVIGRDVLDVYGDGHPSFSPNGRWLLTDSYPNRARQRRLLLFRPEGNELIELGRFFAPWRYDRRRRCDLHPRWSPDGRFVSIDSAHNGSRASYVLNVAQVLEDT